jgi:sulfate/thiosulfate transport system substrate-binding protein
MFLGWRSFRKWLGLFSIGLTLVVAIAACSNFTGAKPNSEILLASYAVTKSAYRKIIPLFISEWERKTGQKVSVQQSYGGSGSQTRAVIDGLEADVVNLALALDVNKIRKAGLIEPGWQEKLPSQAIATTSVVSLSYRKGNPKGIHTWEDLTRPGIEIITANPKTSGVARWNFLAVYGAGKQKFGDDVRAREFTQKFYQNSKILTRDARESTEIFFKQEQGDVLLNYENEVILAASEGREVPFSIPADVNIAIAAPVAVVDTYAKKHGTEAIARAFAEFLFTAPAQREFAKLGFRPTLPEVAAEFKDQFPKIDKLLTAQDFGDWDQIQTEFFADGAVFDRIQANLGQ